MFHTSQLAQAHHDRTKLHVPSTREIWCSCFLFFWDKNLVGLHVIHNWSYQGQVWNWFLHISSTQIFHINIWYFSFIMVALLCYDNVMNSTYWKVLLYACQVATIVSNFTDSIQKIIVWIPMCYVWNYNSSLVPYTYTLICDHHA